MADNKIIELVEAKAPASTDLALLVAEPSINPSNKKLTLGTLFNKIPSWLGFSQAPITYTSGAIDITSPISFLSVTGTVAFTLAAGSQGQIKTLVCTVAATTAAKAFTVTSSSGLLVTSEAHGLIDTQIIQVTSAGTLPTGLSAGVDYFVRDKTDDTFKLALTSGGTAIAYTNAGSGIHSWTTNPVGTLTPVATANDGYNTITFNTVGQSATLMYSIKSGVWAVRRSPVFQSKIFNADEPGTKWVESPPIVEKCSPLRSYKSIIDGRDLILSSTTRFGNVMRLEFLSTFKPADSIRSISASHWTSTPVS